MILFYKLVLNIYSRSAGVAKKGLRIVLEILRRLLITLGDPHFRTLVHGKDLILPVSHKLPIYLADYPLYDSLPARISAFLRERDGYLCMIDIGANIGDTILACHAREDDQFLAVDANMRFIQCLRENTITLKDLVILEAYCGSGADSNVNVQIATSGGTARVSIQKAGPVLPRKSLDMIFNEYPQYDKVNFLKIDTDGGDFDILLSGQRSLRKYKPTILFECDVFGNRNYVDEFMNAINFLSTAGYSTALVYSNIGYLFDIVDLEHPTSFRYILFYQLISKFGYYDLLILKPEDAAEFIKRETSFFIQQTSDGEVAARRALEI